MQQISEEAQKYSSKEYGRYLGYYSAQEQEGTKIVLRRKKLPATILVFRLVLLLVSLICVTGMIVSYLPYRDVLLPWFLISLVATNSVFFVVSQNTWRKRFGLERTIHLLPVFLSCTTLAILSAILPKETVASILFLICCWFLALCIHVISIVLRIVKNLQMRQN